jgi:hypothetical protein
MPPTPELSPAEPAVAAAQSDRPRRRSDVSVRVVEGEIIVWDRQAGLIHQFNRTATRVWECCDGAHTVAAIADRLTQDFDVDPATARRDVAAVVAQLRQLNLVEPRSG